MRHLAGANPSAHPFALSRFQNTAVAPLLKSSAIRMDVFGMLNIIRDVRGGYRRFSAVTKNERREERRREESADPTWR